MNTLYGVLYLVCAAIWGYLYFHGKPEDWHDGCGLLALVFLTWTLESIYKSFTED